MAFRYAPQGAVISLPSTASLGGIAKFCFSSDGLGVVYSNPNYDGFSLGTNRGQIKFASWDGAAWIAGDTFYGAPPSLPAASTDYNNLFAGEILAASADLSIIAYSQRFTGDSSQKHIFWQDGATISTRLRVDPFFGYVPSAICLSSTGGRLAVLFLNNGSDPRIKVLKKSGYSTPELEGDFQNITGANFSMSGDGNLVFAGTTLKSWDGTDWQTGATFAGATASAINSDGTRLVVNDGAAAKVFSFSGGTWTQLGASFSPSDALWISPDGSRVQVGAQIYSWTGSAWITFTALPSAAVISSSGESAGVLLDDYNSNTATTYHLQAYELLENPFPFYTPARATAIYAGATEGKALYYGAQLLWNAPGWEPPAFSPASIAGLSLWLDASVGLYDAATGGNPVTTAAPVLRWEDQSGNGFHATAVSATAPSLALSQVNSLPGILFPSTGGKYFNLPNPLPAGGTGATIFVVTQPTQTGSDGGPLVGMIGSNTEYWSDSHYPYRNSNIEDGFAATTRKTITPLPSGMFTWHLYNVVSGAGDWRYLFNGSVYFSTASNTYNGASFSGRTPKIGYSASRGTWYFRGTIAEIVIYNSALSEPDRQTVTEYLRAKYNLW